MITAIDTNILLDVLIPGQAFATASKHLLDHFASRGRLIVCDVVFAELSAGFPSAKELDEFLLDTGIDHVPSSPETLFLAGSRWSAYTGNKPENRMICHQCGQAVTADCPHCRVPLTKRLHFLADFIIGAHALIHADGILSRDLGIYKTYFPDLRVIRSL